MKKATHYVMTQKQPVEPCAEPGVKIKVVPVIKVMKASSDECPTYLLHWARKRKDSIRLCTDESPVFKIFKIAGLGCILELQLSEW